MLTKNRLRIRGKFRNIFSGSKTAIIFFIQKLCILDIGALLFINTIYGIHDAKAGITVKTLQK